MPFSFLLLLVLFFLFFLPNLPSNFLFCSLFFPTLFAGPVKGSTGPFVGVVPCSPLGLRESCPPCCFRLTNPLVTSLPLFWQKPVVTLFFEPVVVVRTRLLRFRPVDRSSPFFFDVSFFFFLSFFFFFSHPLLSRGTGCASFFSHQMASNPFIRIFPSWSPSGSFKDPASPRKRNQSSTI